MKDNVSRIRALLREAVPRQPPAADESEIRLRRAFDYYEFNVGLPVVEPTPRARALRDIARISTWYGWHNEIARALDRAGVSAAGELTDDDVFELRDRMASLELAAQTGCDAPDSLPAR